MTTEEIFQVLKRLIAEEFAVSDITMETSFEADLGADSLGLVELVMAMEEEFEIGEVQEYELTALKTVGDAVNFVAGRLRG